jgi:DNA adenine methylase
MNYLPLHIDKVTVPPIKCQGIKTKLVPFIAQNISWDGNGKWIEPFLGSGVVAFNIRPERAVLSDSNKHIIKFYREIQKGNINKTMIREALSGMGSHLEKQGAGYYYEVRQKFNESGDPVLFLFLNRSCFNGLMRFNAKGGFNVPFGHKPQRFSKAYITKISNQVANISQIIKNRDWYFIVADWKEILKTAEPDDFVYLDPPYIGRSTDYYNQWTNDDAVSLASQSNSLPCKYALSMWLENKYRKNSHIENHWGNTGIKTYSHFYHIGSTESLRNKMTEALVIK